jgi:copper(I)-binding protein
MNRPIPRRQLLQIGVAAGVSFVAGPARACEYFAPNLRITHPWTRASGPDEHVALVCMRFGDVSLADRLIAVHTPVADSAEMGGVAKSSGVDLFIPAGRETELSEQGVHIRLLDLKFPLEVARSYPLTLVFERGGAVEATLNIDYARFG